MKHEPEHIFTLLGLVIFKERAGVISPRPVWVAFISEYMYTGDTLPGLLLNIARQWKDDKNLIG